MAQTGTLLVGLGNPGARYAGNRHNVGFMAVEAIAARHRLPPWRKRFLGAFTDGPVNGGRAYVLLPGTWSFLSRPPGSACRMDRIRLSD